MPPNEVPIALLYSASFALILMLTVIGASSIAQAAYHEKRAQHTSSLSGEQWVQELLSGHPIRIRNELGMRRGVFLQLLAVLRRKAGVNDTRYVSAEEQLATFLYFVRRGLPNRGLQERFQRSGDTISKCVDLNITSVFWLIYA
jgi:hypothetical protein